MKRKNKKYYKTAYSAEEKLNALNLWRHSTVEFVAHRYHCTIQTLYRWRKIFDGTLESLEPKYCAPYTPHPNRHADVKKKHKYVPQHYDTPIHIGEKWQLDVKFVPRQCYVCEFKDERRYYQYTVIDEATRERFIFPYQDQCAQSTIDFVRRAVIFFVISQN